MPRPNILDQAEKVAALASTRYCEYYVWDPITRRRRISLRHILRIDDTTFCGLSIPTATASTLSPEAIASQYPEMVCRRCHASAQL